MRVICHDSRNITIRTRVTPVSYTHLDVYKRQPEVEGVTGKYFAKGKVKVPSANARDEAAAARLWDVSEDLVARAAT